jgi:hypothetical protein
VLSRGPRIRVVHEPVVPISTHLITPLRAVKHTEQPPNSLAFPSFARSYTVFPSPIIAITYGNTTPGRLFLYVSKNNPSPSKRSVCPNTLPGFARSLVTQSAKPSPCRFPLPAIENSISISQLLAVKGMRLKIQPDCEGWSAARRTYLSARITVSPPKSHQREVRSESR